MIFLVIIISLISAFISGLGWGGNGSKKEQVALFGMSLMLIGAIVTFMSYGWVYLVVYMGIVPAIAKGFEGYFESKYRNF